MCVCVCVHVIVMFLVSYIQFNRLLLRAQQCCHLHFGEVANKIQESLPSEEYQKGRIKSEK